MWFAETMGGMDYHSSNLKIKLKNDRERAREREQERASKNVLDEGIKKNLMKNSQELFKYSIKRAH